MIYVCCQPATMYYAWQIEVMMTNFVRFGIEPYNCYVVVSDDDIVPFQMLRDKFKFNLAVYKDTRKDKSYVPSIYFHLLKKFLSDYNPKTDIFIHDADIVLTRPLELPKSRSWLVADTRSYLNYDYVSQFGLEQYNAMCEIVKLDPIIPRLMNSNTGGAQYIINNADYAFFDKVERDSVKIYELLRNGGTNIQSFTAGMWSFMYNAWKVGHETLITDKLSFCDAVTPIQAIERVPIMHNAGVMGKGRDFKKTDFIDRLPYGLELDIDKTKASYYYYQQIQNVDTILKRNTPILSQAGEY